LIALLEIKNFVYLRMPKCARKRNRNRRHESRDIYGNCKMLAPDGSFMCYISEKRARRHVERQRATLIAEQGAEQPLTVRLNFEPKGRGGPNGPRLNECARCGSTDNLERFRLVPRCYSRHMIFSHEFHGIVPLCQECHLLGERASFDLREIIATELQIPTRCLDEKAARLARVLLQHGQQMPPAKKNELLCELRELAPGLGLGLDVDLDLEGEGWAEVLRASVGDHGKRVVDRLREEPDGLSSLVSRFRDHFVSRLQPRFLPFDWNAPIGAVQFRSPEGLD
jgi:hypothetical protein